MTFKVNILGLTKCTIYCKKWSCFCCSFSLCCYYEAMPGGVHVARLNFKTSRIGVYKCLLLIVGFAFTVAIRPREIVSCLDFILCAVTTFWAMSLVRIYPGRASTMLIFKIKRIISSEKWWLRRYFFLLKMQKFWVGRVTLRGEWGMEWNGTTLCYFLMPFVCSNINIIPFLFSAAGSSIGTKRSFCVPLRNSPL